MFYANEHEPVHVHGKFQDRESRAEIIVVNGEIAEIRYTNVAGRAPLGNIEMRYFEELVSAQTVDFKPFLSLARHPDIRAYLEPSRFAAFRIEHGELVWGDYDLCFPIADLYQNRLMPDSALEKAA